MTIKLNQILAIEKGLKSHGYGDFTKMHQGIQKEAAISGIARSYKPENDGDVVLPAESTQVQVRVKDVMKDVQLKLTELFDVVATKDFSNCEAKADIIIDADTDTPHALVSGVPVSYLLWLEKQLNDIYTFVKGFPTLSPTEEWKWSDGQNCYASLPAKTKLTKKISKAFVKYEATQFHPAQVDVIVEDEIVGFWTTIKFSGALPAKEVESMKNRVQQLQKAVKFAREQANSIEVTQVKLGEKILGFVFGANP
jgi:hypothetical protein